MKDCGGRTRVKKERGTKGGGVKKEGGTMRVKEGRGRKELECRRREG